MYIVLYVCTSRATVYIVHVLYVHVRCISNIPVSLISHSRVHTLHIESPCLYIYVWYGTVLYSLHYSTETQRHRDTETHRETHRERRRERTEKREREQKASACSHIHHFDIHHM